jgi:hypothetical protein
VLTAADEWHVHQTPEPIAVAGTDRNFYDRSFFGGWTPDGSAFFAIAFGIYPHLNVADAHLTIVRDGRQHCLHASKVLHSDRATLAVGPISIEIVEPLAALRVRVTETDGLAADLLFTGRHFPVEEPRFMFRFGPRAFMDYTRLSQAARVTGSLGLDGETIAVDGVGVRDRSWGIRPIGAGDPAPMVPAQAPQFFWLWSPVQFAEETTFWHANEDAAGVAWNTRAVVCPDGGEQSHTHGDMTLSLSEGTRWVDGATLVFGDRAYEYEPITHLEMQGIGYRHPEWSHGTYRGTELDVAREDFALADSDPNDLHRWHRQILCRVRCGDETGMGILEHLIIGAHAPTGLT